LDNIIKNPHHGDSLLFTKSLVLEPLDELQRIEMVVSLPRRGSMKSPTGWLKGRNIDPIMADRSANRLCTLGLSLVGYRVRKALSD
jgi:hypothetical protein